MPFPQGLGTGTERVRVTSPQCLREGQSSSVLAPSWQHQKEPGGLLQQGVKVPSVENTAQQGVYKTLRVEVAAWEGEMLGQPLLAWCTSQAAHGRGTWDLAGA